MDPRTHFFNPYNAILGFGSYHTFPYSIPNQDVFNTTTKPSTSSPYPVLVPPLPPLFPPVPPEPPPPMPPEPKQCQPTCNHSTHQPHPVLPIQGILYQWISLHRWYTVGELFN